MSASLVGSEMCIRDSMGQAWRHLVEGNGCADSRLFIGWNMRSWYGWPVSYTHLTLPTICSV
eukprot:443182-Alexandrium_andersonii.AAC.1